MAGNNITQIDSVTSGGDSSVEDLSALLDGESAHLGAAEIDAIVESEESRGQWSRYQLIGDVLRQAQHDGAPPYVDTAFADKIRNQIDSEPTVLASRGAKSKRNLPAYLQPVAGLAIAASVAGLAVIGIQSMSVDSQNQAQPISVANLEAAEQVMARTVAATDTNETPELEIDLEEHKRRLNSYLVNFNEQRASLGMPGVNPYVRIIDFESEK